MFGMGVRSASIGTGIWRHIQHEARMPWLSIERLDQEYELTWPKITHT